MRPSPETLHWVAFALLIAAALMDIVLVYLLKALSAGGGGEFVDEFRAILLLMGLGAIFFAGQLWAADPARLHYLVDTATGPGSLVALVAVAVALEMWLIARLLRRRRRILARARVRERLRRKEG